MSMEPFPPPGAPPPGVPPPGSAGNGHGIPARDWDDEAAFEAFSARVESGDYDIPDDDDDWDDQAAALQAAGAAAEFTQGAPADVMAPGPMLAAIAHDATASGTAGSGSGAEVLAGVGDLTDNQLAGMIGAGRRLASWGSSLQIAATAELASRRRTGEAAAIRCGREVSEFAADEVACELKMTRAAAGDYMAFSSSLRHRLAATFAALNAGIIDDYRGKIITEAVAFLSDEDALKVEALILPAAGRQTTGRLRAALARAVTAVDDQAAQRRKDAAAAEARISKFREDSGNGALSGRELPADEVLASWQHVDARARALRAAGMPGTLRELRVRAFLDLLLERDARDGPPPPDDIGTGAREQDPGDWDNPDDEPGDGPGGPPGPPDPGYAGPSGQHATTPAPGTQTRGTGSRTSVAALINITVPLGTMFGTSSVPGEAAGFGLLDPETARRLAKAAARHQDTRWCVTVIAPDGTAVAHGCAAGHHSHQANGDISGNRDGPSGRDRPAAPGDPPERGSQPEPGGSPARDGPPGPEAMRPGAGFLSGLRVKLTPVTRGPCDHSAAEPGYVPSRKLGHLIRARNPRCTAPHCGQPAASCDLDHTFPWHRGGITCECDLSPLCRHHHRCKQSEGWWLEQLEPGILRWTVPSGRHYTTYPGTYPL
jgi:hypothetical protein